MKQYFVIFAVDCLITVTQAAEKSNLSKGHEHFGTNNEMQKKKKKRKGQVNMIHDKALILVYIVV